MLRGGDLDPTFGVRGSLVIDNTSNTFADVAIQPDGKLVTVGSVQVLVENFDDYEYYDSDFLITRRSTDGTLDRSFGTGGTVTVDFGWETDDFATCVAIDGNGRIIVAGSTGDHFDGYSAFAVTRLNPDGTIDKSFGVNGNGTVRTDFGWHSDAVANCVMIDPSGEIVVTGNAELNADIAYGSMFAVSRYYADGTPDRRFSSDGKLTIGNHNDFATSATIDVAGRILVAGETYDDDMRRDVALVRINRDGSLDSSFGDDGKRTYDFGLVDARAAHVSLGDNGKILLAGSVVNQIGRHFALARFNSDGSADTSFGDGGITVANPDKPEFNETFDMAVAPNGQIVLAGQKTQNAGFAFTVARFNDDGTTDKSFGDSGQVTTAFGRDPIFGISAAIDGDGKIVVGHARRNTATLARYLSGGQIGERISVSLPATSSTVIALFVSGELHIRRSKHSTDLVAPVSLSNVRQVHFQGTEQNDRLVLDRSMTMWDGSVLFNGHAGDDLFDASAVRLDVVFDGGAGADRFLGGSGYDFADGGPDNDTLNGGSGNDSILGRDGRDMITGAGGHDVIDGGDDHDTLSGGDDDDSIRGGNGNDRITGGKGNDLLIGSAGNDVLQGDAGLDTLLGDSGNDSLNGGVDSDTINTGTGSDRITDSSRVIDTSFAIDFDELLAKLL